MKVILVVSVVLVAAWAVSGNPLGKLKQSKGIDGNLVRQKKAVQDNYEPVGCYSFNTMKKLKIFDKKAYKNTKATSEKPLDQCIPGANENNYDIIGIQKIKKNIICRKGNKEPDAAIEKLDLKKCKNDVGSKKTIFIYRNPATCSANNKIYHHGDDIVFHNATNPIQDAACTSCKCSAGNITDCSFMYCDLGLRGWPIEVCDNWITGQEGVCCPRCVCSNNGDTWVKRLSSGFCYECSCNDKRVHCSDGVKCLDCPGITVPVPGKCCPKCIPTPKPPTTGPVFTIELTSTRSPPVFPPFPFDKKRDVISRDGQFDGGDFEEMEQ